MNLEGKMLGNRYEIIEKIGSGGMATVYRAKCHVLNRYVAVKILRDEFTTDEEFIKRFEVEAQSAASITHPNIVSVYDVGVDGNLYYIVMELVQGKTLKEIIVKERGPLSWKWSVNIAIQIASALEIAHKNNIVHRDIKPHNIIITEDGIAKVTDFGIAKAVSNSTITAFGTTIGSVHYFSPEHARGGYTDAKSDLYSLGVVMYEMLTGKVPFDADTPVSIALKHMQEDAVPPIEVNSKIPQAVNDIILKALKKDVTLRYQSSTDMLIDLNRALKDPNGDFVDNKEYEEDFPTQKISTMYGEEIKSEKRKKKENKFVKFIKKHKVLSIFIGLILLFALSLGGTMLYLDITNPKEVDLPKLVGMKSEEAKSLVEGLKVTYEVESEEYSTEYEAGYIISQDPEYNDNYAIHIKEKSTIKVVVSKGTEETTVPKVVGMQKDEAIEELENSKLVPEIQEETSKTVEEGYVIKQDTDSGTTVNAGETVIIHVSIGTGIKQVAVPSVIGKDEASAKSTLESTGLKVTIAYDENTTRDNGTVLKQSIDAGKTVDEQTEIIITVNKLAEKKTATVYVNLKSLTGGYSESTSEEGETTSTKKTARVIVEVNGENICNEDVDINTTKFNPGNNKVIGVGTVTIKVFVDGVKEAERDINLNTTSSYTID